MLSIIAVSCEVQLQTQTQAQEKQTSLSVISEASNQNVQELIPNFEIVLD